MGVYLPFWEGTAENGAVAAGPPEDDVADWCSSGGVPVLAHVAKGWAKLRLYSLQLKNSCNCGAHGVLYEQEKEIINPPSITTQGFFLGRVAGTHEASWLHGVKRERFEAEIHQHSDKTDR